eukprot:TRINITY_DN4212_c0_g1_i1.p1 TRINITY_DN4212_c0_g1~~TRINITY_DN4212_c0_g1_i1.p1  ORF type:complete len:342 (+),score=69.57 TRINITY_DN4212_c0_g1_i1:92-1117(+)
MSGTSWYFSISELMKPVKEGGTEWKVAKNQRRTTCDFLQKAGMELNLPQLTIYTGIVYFHRFFAKNDFKDYDCYTVGTTCLFLAGKCEETPKKLKDVIIVTHGLRHKDAPRLNPESEEYKQFREQILINERIVLQTIAFDLRIEHPYTYLLQYIKKIDGDRDLAQVAWNFINDSLRTVLCLQFKPQLIALAAIYLSSKFLKKELTVEQDGKGWWDVLDANIPDLEDISNQILDLYQKNDNVDAIKNETKRVNELHRVPPPPVQFNVEKPVPPPPEENPPPPPPEEKPPSPRSTPSLSHRSERRSHNGVYHRTSPDKKYHYDRKERDRSSDRRERTENHHRR